MSQGLDTLPLNLRALRAAYEEQRFTARQLITALREKAYRLAPPGVWIYQLDDTELEPYLAALESASVDALPLYGVPFVIKDNIDLAGVPTTAACEAASYLPQHSAVVVQRLIDAGAVPLGKTNLDQFATGLVGTRSPQPWGPCGNAFDPAMISGGSSAGSAVAVALGLASFSLGTDTAGSGRVPAAFNNLVGVKPSRGLLSSRGMVPACRSLDTISLFALLPEDAAQIYELVAAYDREDSFSRTLPDTVWPALSSTPWFRIAVPLPDQLLVDDSALRERYQDAIVSLQALGAEIVEADFSPLLEAAKLLYEGPWVAERTLAVDALLNGKLDDVHPVVAEIVEGGGHIDAMQTFAAQYRLQSLRSQTAAFFANVDFALTPTTPGIYSIQAVLDDPVALNSRLGYYTNFMNLLDLAAIAVPAGFLPSGLPCGVTLFGPAGSDRALLQLAQRYLNTQEYPLGATGLPTPSPEPVPLHNGDWVELAVCGAHLSGCALNHQLTDRGARLVDAGQTTHAYRLYCLPGGPPARPALVRVTEGGTAIDIETWALPGAALASFMSGIPAPLAIGRLTLASGREVAGFVCEDGGVAGATDITHYGGWRAYLASLN
ncbi:MAG: allophanate hydrolase [Pseudomonadota bacterium]